MWSILLHISHWFSWFLRLYSVSSMHWNRSTVAKKDAYGVYTTSSKKSHIQVPCATFLKRLVLSRDVDALHIKTFPECGLIETLFSSCYCWGRGSLRTFRSDLKSLCSYELKFREQKLDFNYSPPDPEPFFWLGNENHIAPEVLEVKAFHGWDHNTTVYIIGNNFVTHTLKMWLTVELQIHFIW